MLKKLMLITAMMTLLLSSVVQGVVKMPNKENIEIRELSFSPSDIEDENSLSGLAISYKSNSTPLYDYQKRTKYIERILVGAATESIETSDVQCLHQHDNKYVIGRTKNNTLELKEEIDGLYFKVLIPNTTWAKDLATSVRRGDIDKMSFGFIPLESRWIDDEATISEYGMPVREISKIDLREISIVANPAYDATDVRGLDEANTPAKNQETNINNTIDISNIEQEARDRQIAILKTRI